MILIVLLPLPAIAATSLTYFFPNLLFVDWICIYTCGCGQCAASVTSFQNWFGIIFKFIHICTCDLSNCNAITIATATRTHFHARFKRRPIRKAVNLLIWQGEPLTKLPKNLTRITWYLLSIPDSFCCLFTPTFKTDLYLEQIHN